MAAPEEWPATDPQLGRTKRRPPILRAGSGLGMLGYMQRKNNGGRPDKLTPEVQESIILHLKHGCYLETAAAAAGVSKVTLFHWLRQGRRQKRSKYREFLNSVEKAMAEAELRDVQTVDRAANGYDVVKTKEVVDASGKTISSTVERTHEFSVQAAEWRLERKYPKRWGRREHHEITGSKGGPVQTRNETIVDFRSLPADELRNLRDLRNRVLGRTVEAGSGN